MIRRQLHVPWKVALLTAALLGSPTPSRGADEAASTRQRHDRLVNQLGDSSYPVRSQAARQLAKIGLPARAALLRGMEHPDLEIRLAAEHMLTQLLQSDFEQRLAAFLEGDRADIGQQLPGWDRFAEIAGNKRASRGLFVEMLRHERPLLDALAGKSEAEPLQPLIERRIQECMSSRFTNGVPGAVREVSLAALLFVMCQQQAQQETLPGATADSRLYALLNNSSCKQVVLQGEHSALLLQLLGKWIEQQSVNLQSYYALRLSLTYGLEELGAKLGRKFLQSDRGSSQIIPYAAICLARFGKRQDAALLVDHLENTTVCHTWSNPNLKKDLIRIQVRDVVLALLLHLTDQDPGDYGYELLKPDPVTLYRIYTFGFLEDAQRDAALKKWNAWLRAHQAEFPALAKGD